MPLLHERSHSVQTLATYGVLAALEGKVDPTTHGGLEAYLFEHLPEYGLGNGSWHGEWYLINMAAMVARNQLVKVLSNATER